MHRTSASIGLTLAVVLAQGCVSSERPAAIPAAPAAAAPSAGTAECDAAAAQAVVGSLATAETTERAELLAGVETVRVIGPGQPVTQDSLPDRLNIETDGNNAVVNVRCG